VGCVGSTEDLVKRAQAGDTRAYDALFSSCWQRVVSLCYALTGDMQMAEDAAMEAFLRAYRDLRSLRRPASFMGWLGCIAHNTCTSHLRRAARRSAAAGHADASCCDLRVSGPDDDPAARLAAAQLREAVWACIDQLEVEHRMVLLARIGSGLTWAEVAASVGTTEGGARYTLTQARAQVATCLRRRGFDDIHV